MVTCVLPMCTIGRNDLLCLSCRNTQFCGTVLHCKRTCTLASFPGHSQILSHSCGEKPGDGLVPILRHGSAGCILCGGHVAIIMKSSPRKTGDGLVSILRYGPWPHIAWACCHHYEIESTLHTNRVHHFRSIT